MRALGSTLIVILSTLGPLAGTTPHSRLHRVSPVPPAERPCASASQASILVYHQLGPAATHEMVVRTDTFRWQLTYLRQHGYHVVPLRTLVSCLRGETAALPSGAVAITADDGRESVFTDMLPVVREFRVPVTLFIYPSSISNASYALTWPQLAALRDTGLFDIESHTYWHPDFRIERRRLSPAAYRGFVTSQLVRSRTVLQQKLGVQADLLAWPFGVCDDELIGLAEQAGYRAAFTLEPRRLSGHDRLLALPRFLIVDRDTGRRFAAKLPPEPR